MGHKKAMNREPEQTEKCVPADDLKEMKSSALSIRRKLDDTGIDNVENVMEEYHGLVDRFYQSNEHLMAPQQYRVARHDFDYFMRLLNLAIHYSDSSLGGDRTAPEA